MRGTQVKSHSGVSSGPQSNLRTQSSSNEGEVSPQSVQEGKKAGKAAITFSTYLASGIVGDFWHKDNVVRDGMPCQVLFQKPVAH